MTTVATLITDSLIEIGVQDPGESVASNLSSYAIRTINRLFDRVNLSRAAVYTYSRQEFALTAGDASYTFGPSGDFNSTNDGRIRKAGLLRTDTNTETEIQLIDYRAYADLVDRASSGVPLYLYDSRTAPINTLAFWPTPDNTYYKVVLYTDYEMPQVSALSDTLVIPGAMEELMLTELAIVLAGALATQVSQSLMMRNSKAWNAIIEDNTLRMDADLSAHFEYRGSSVDVKTGRII